MVSESELVPSSLPVGIVAEKGGGRTLLLSDSRAKKDKIPKEGRKMRRYMNSSKTSPTKLSPKSLHHGWKRQTLRGNFVKALPSQFESFPWFSTPYMQRKTFTSSTSSFKDDNRPASISIGDITGQVKQPQNPHLVPSAGNTGELLKELTNEEISHLRYVVGENADFCRTSGGENRR